MSRLRSPFQYTDPSDKGRSPPGSPLSPSVDSCEVHLAEGQEHGLLQRPMPYIALQSQGITGTPPPMKEPCTPIARFLLHGQDEPILRTPRALGDITSRLPKESSLDPDLFKTAADDNMKETMLRAIWACAQILHGANVHCSCGIGPTGYRELSCTTMVYAAQFENMSSTEVSGRLLASRLEWIWIRVTSMMPTHQQHRETIEDLRFDSRMRDAAGCIISALKKLGISVDSFMAENLARIAESPRNTRADSIRAPMEAATALLELPTPVSIFSGQPREDRSAEDPLDLNHMMVDNKAGKSSDMDNSQSEAKHDSSPEHHPKSTSANCDHGEESTDGGSSSEQRSPELQSRVARDRVRRPGYGKASANGHYNTNRHPMDDSALEGTSEINRKRQGQQAPHRNRKRHKIEVK